MSGRDPGMSGKRLDRPRDLKPYSSKKHRKAYTGLEHAYYLNSATAGLNLAVEILKEGYGWADGDEIITTPLTFVSTNHAIPLAGLKAVFADIDDTNCLSPASVRERITERTRALIYVGMGGNTGHYEEIAAICEDAGIKLIPDAAHMSGTRLYGEIPGKEAEVVIYSYQAVKKPAYGRQRHGLLQTKKSSTKLPAKKDGLASTKTPTAVLSMREIINGNTMWNTSGKSSTAIPSSLPSLLTPAPLSGPPGQCLPQTAVGCLGIGNSSANTRSWWN